MFGHFDELSDYIEESGVEMIDLKVTDFSGRWRHVTLPVASFTRQVAETGVGFDGSSVGFTSLESGDLAVKPDLNTAFPDPFHTAPAVSIICDVVEADTGGTFRVDPRSVARRVEEHLRACGLADVSRWGPELEFYVFQRVEVRNSGCVCAVELEPVGNAASNLPSRPGQSYFAAPPSDTLDRFREKICRELVAAGVPVKYHHHEIGRLGQVEIELPLDGLLCQADRVQIVKYFARMCARKEGLSVTFMPKPMHGEAGSGMHFHQHLFRDGQPLFYESNGYAGLSEGALRYVAGLLSHGRALSAFTNPSTNSFKRLVPGFEAPVKLFYSLANRSAAVRVPKYATRPEDKRIEYRPPDGTCNPYLAMAAMLMAGLDGMKRKLNPGSMGFGPFDEDVFQWSEARREKLQALPRSLEEAVEALSADRAFLAAGGVFPTEVIDLWMARSLMTACGQMAVRPHPYEFELYYDC